MESNLSDLQKKLLDILKWVSDFCNENGLKYYILYGTLLGAVRHKGFIPWDDDIDIGMPRPDYERFLKITKDKKFGNYVVEGIDTEKSDFFYGYTKIYDTSTTLTENNRYKIKRGIFLDVFPLDGIGNTKEEALKNYRPISLRYKLLLSRTCGINKNRKFYKNAAIVFSRFIPNFIINNKKLMLSIDSLCKSKDYNSCRYVGNLLGGLGENVIVERRIYGEPKIYTFENLSVFGVEYYEDYLSNFYGDWRKLPPKEKRVSNHDFLELDLQKSYLEN